MTADQALDRVELARASPRHAAPPGPALLAASEGCDRARIIGRVQSPAQLSRALRKMRYRKRLRNGVITLRVSVDEVALAEALLLARRLDERAALDRVKLARELEAVVGEWVERWVSGRR